MAEATEAKLDDTKAEAAAEKAYAAAAEKIEAPQAAKPVAAPAAAVVPAAAPRKAAKPAAPAKAVAKPAAKAAKPATKRAPLKTAPKTVKKAAKAAPAPQIKDTIMTKTKIKTDDFTAKVKTAFGEAQDKAKVAYEKGTALMSEATEFTKGNVEAVVESGKILAAGLQDMGKGYVTEGKSAFETLTADVKELAAVKSPTDFFKLQGEIMRRNFDAAVATGSKQSEAMLKLANDAFAPISSRVSLAIEKVKQAA